MVKLGAVSALLHIELVLTSEEVVQPGLALDAVNPAMLVLVRARDLDLRGHAIEVGHAALDEPLCTVEHPGVMSDAKADHPITNDRRRLLSPTEPPNLMVRRVSRAVTTDDHDV